MNTKSFKKWFSLVVLFIGGGLIFQIPFLRNAFYVPMVDALKISNEEFGQLSSMYAIISIFSYLIGGYLADRVSVRKLLAISLVGTGLLGIWLSMLPSFGTMKVIYALLGVTTVMTYWPSLIKATRLLGESNEQGRMFGILEGGRGIVSALFVFVLLAMFNALGGGRFGMSWVIRSYALLDIGIGVATYCLIQDDKKTGEKSPLLVTQIKEVLLMPRVWLICLIVFTAYCVYATLGFISPYMVAGYGLSQSVSVQMGGFRYLMQLAGGLLGGFLADKIFKSQIKVIFGGYFLLAVSMGLFLIMPMETAWVGACLANFVLFGVTAYAVRALYFSIIDQLNIKKQNTGAVSGLASCIGYIPDVFLYTMIGRWIDQMGTAGYKNIFRFNIGICAVGVVIAFIAMRTVKNISVSKAAQSGSK